MNWDEISNVVAIVGVFAIALALVYVAAQIKAATRQRTLDSYQSVLAEIDGFCKLIADDADNAEVWWRASKGLAKLTDAERVRYFAMVFILFRSWEKAFHHRSEGELEQWNAEIVTKPMVDFMMSDGMQEYWALRKHWYTSNFRHWVDELIKNRSGVDIYGEQFRIFGSADPRDADTAS